MHCRLVTRFILFTIHNGADVYFIILKLVENQLGWSPVLFLYFKNAAEEISDISGRKTAGLPSRLPDVCVTTYQDNNITLQQTPRNHAMSNKLNF